MLPMADTQIRPRPPVAFASGGRGNFDIFLALFCGLLLLSNIGATKLIAVNLFGAFPLTFDGGAILFPLTYVIGDVLAEVYGLRRAKRAIVTGFGLSIVASLTFLAVAAAPPDPSWTNQEAFEAILGFVPRIVVASLVGYVVGQWLNAWVLVRIKRITAERNLWIRLIGSTIVGEAADTTLFCLIAWGGLIGAGTMVNYIVVGFVYKVAVETICLPVTYLVIGRVKRHEPDYAPVTA